MTPRAFRRGETETVSSWQILEQLQEKFTFTSTYDDTYMETDIVEQFDGVIAREVVFVEYYDKEGECVLEQELEDYTLGFNSNEINDDLKEYTWFVDKDCTIEFEGFDTLNSFDTIILYTNELIICSE